MNFGICSCGKPLPLPNEAAHTCKVTILSNNAAAVPLPTVPWSLSRNAGAV